MKCMHEKLFILLKDIKKGKKKKINNWVCSNYKYTQKEKISHLNIRNQCENKPKYSLYFPESICLVEIFSDALSFPFSSLLGRNIL